MIQKRLLVAALALATALTLPQEASAQARPDERAAAREFSYAAYRLRVKVKAAFATKDEMVRLFTSTGRVEIVTDDVPRRARSEAESALVEAAFGLEYGRMAPAMQTFQAELDRVQTADPALRNGRALWRAATGFLGRLRPAPADACEQLHRWARAGYPKGAAPTFQPEAIRALMRETTRSGDGMRSGDGGEDQRLRRAAARMVQLGVSPGQARRFAGDNLFDGDPFHEMVEGR